MPESPRGDITRLCDYGERSHRAFVKFVYSLAANVRTMDVFSFIFFWTLLSLQLLVSGDLIVESDVVYVIPKGSEVASEDGPVERVARSADVDGNHLPNSLRIGVNLRVSLF